MNRTYNNLLAILFVVFVLTLMVILGGCMTTYAIEKQMGDGSSVTVQIKSFREFEQPQVHYQRVGGDVVFDFGAESAMTAQSPIESAFAEVLVKGGTIGASLAGDQ